MEVQTKIEDRNEKRTEIALGFLAEDYYSFLQTLLIEAGYNDQERNKECQIFQSYFHLSLIAIAIQLKELKSNKSCELNEEEVEIIMQLKPEDNMVQETSQMARALKLFQINFIPAITNIMRHANFEFHQTIECNEHFISFISRAFSLLTKMFLSRRFCKRKNKMIKDSLQPYKRKTNKKTTIKLVTITEKHYIYYLCTASSKLALKIIKKSSLKQKDIDLLKNELQMGNQVKHPCVRTAHKITLFRNSPSLVLNWAQGLALNKIKLDISSFHSFFKIAREVVSVLRKMHDSSIMHLNLCCENIIFDKPTNSMKIIGFGYAASFSARVGPISHFDLQERELHELSPEQLGILRKKIDHRSDFYSLGVIFYRILTGRLPFEHVNMFDFVNKKICNTPTPVHLVQTDIPPAISQMISKLMEKNAEDRYQTAKGIMFDLDMMITEYENDTSLSHIVLAQHDIPKSLLVSQKLYGRTKELLSLSSAFERASSGSFEIAMIAGCAGSGKSRLALELYDSVVKGGGIFAAGKYDKSKSEPFCALVEAFVCFCDIILLKDRESFLKYKNRILEAVGDEGKVLTDLISNLHLLIGMQPPVAETFGKETTNRLNYTLLKFFKAICALGSPVVFFIDDFQWMDLASARFLCELVLDKSIKNFMLIGTYRSNEVSSDHPFLSFVDKTKKSEVNLSILEIGNLNHDAINALVTDSLRLAPFDCYPLSTMIFKKTKGNIFFAAQLLQSLFDSGLIFFCNEKLKWSWDMSNFDEKLSEDVLELLRIKIQAYDKDIQMVLMSASCIGSPFLLPNLKIITNYNIGIEKTLSTGMIVQSNGNEFRFVHDQIQQACYSLLPEDPKKMYLYLGMKLREHYNDDDLDKNIFVVANLFINSVDVIEGKTKKSDTAAILAMAGEKAMAASAYHLAFKYLEKALELCGLDCWRTNYVLSLKLCGLASETAYALGYRSKMNMYLDEILKNSSSSLHLILPYCLKIRHSNDLRLFEEAIQTGIEILHQLGTMLVVGGNTYFSGNQEILETKNLLSGTSTKEILNWKKMKDTKSLAIMKIYTELLYSSFFFNPHLYKKIASLMLRLTYEQGLSKYAAYAFCCFGTFFCFDGDKFGLKFGKISLQLLQKFHAKELIPKVYTSFYTRISPFYENLYEVFQPLMDAYRIGFEVGLDDTAPCAHAYCGFAFLSGRELSGLVKEMKKLKQNLRTQALLPGFLSIYQASLNLIGEGDCTNLAVIQGSIFDYRILYSEKTKKRDAARACIYCSMMAYLFHDYPSASKFLDGYRPAQKLLEKSGIHPYFLFYEGLTSAALAKSNAQNDSFIITVKENIMKLKVFCKNSPMNNLNKVLILTAELAMLDETNHFLKKNYEDAILLSEQYNFIHEKAIICENLGAYFLHKDKIKASGFLMKSFYAYKAWGATEKTNHLIKLFPEQLESIVTQGLTCLVSPPNEVNFESQTIISDVTQSLFSTISIASGSKRKRVRFN